MAEKYRNCGKTLTLRHLSPDCAKLLKKGGDLVEVDVDTDPVYAVAANLDAETLSAVTKTLGGRKGLSLAEENALKRQYLR